MQLCFSVFYQQTSQVSTLITPLGLNLCTTVGLEHVITFVLTLKKILDNIYHLTAL